MNSNIKVEDRLDLRGVLCPFNFVKTKLKLEEMQSGQLLEIILDGEEALNNVSKSLKEEGHCILKLEKIDGAFLITVRKG